MRFLITFIIIFVAFNPIFVKGGIIDDLKIQIDDKKNEIKKLEEESIKLENNINEAKKKANTLKNQIQLMENKVYQLKLNINQTELQIDKTDLEIQTLKNNITEKSISINQQKENLAEIIRIINENDQENLIELILKNDNFSDFFSQTQNMENLQIQLQERLELITQLKIKLEEDKKYQEDKLTELENLKENLSGQKFALTNQKNEKETLLKTTKNNENNYQKLLKENEQKIIAIQKEIYDFEEKLRITIDPKSIPAPRKGLLAKPTNGYISQNYGMTDYAKTGVYGGGPHNGVDFANSIGAPIRSAEDGKVTAINDAPYAYGKWIAIDHGNGLTTLYGHLSQQSVYAGQTVKRGQIIGYVGNTGFSTGPHLHFGVYATNTFLIKQSKISGILPVGGHIDPFNYL